MKGVLIGRFQPLHRGHKKVIDTYRSEFDEFELVVGSADEERTEDNPLSFKERKDIIKACYPDLNIVPVADESRDDEGNRRWVEKIKEKTEADKIVSQNPLVKKVVEKYSDMELVEQEMHDPDIYSGTTVRRRIKAGEEWRYLVPECAEDKLAEKLEDIKGSGVQYEFEPGWTKKNAYHDTVDSED